MKDSIGLVIMAIWISAGLYVGSSGILYYDQIELSEIAQKARIMNNKPDSAQVGKVHKAENGLRFSTLEALDAFENYQKIASYFPWLAEVPEKLVLILSSCALGALGGAIRIIRQTSYEGQRLGETKFLSIPAFGALLGIVVLGLSYLLPTILVVDSEIQLRDTTLMFSCLFTGLFSKRFITYLDQYFSTVTKLK